MGRTLRLFLSGSSFRLARKLLILASVVPGLSAHVLAGVNTWTAIGPEGAVVNAVVVDPTNGSIAYTTTDRGGTFKTTDGGQTWSAINQGLTIGGDVDWYLNGLAIDPARPSTLYAGGGGHVFKSIDGGSHWVAVASPFNSSVRRLSFSAGAPARVFALTDKGVFKSEDGAASWIRIYQSPSSFAIVWAFTVSPDDRNTSYVGGSSQGLAVSKDGGQSWTATGPAGIRSIVVDPSRSSTVYAGGYGNGVFKSTDAGATWSPINTGLSAPFSLYIRSLAVDPTAPSTLYAGTDGAGVFKSNDGGSSWAPVNRGLTCLFTEVLAMDPSNPARIYAGFEGAGIFTTADGGQNWTPRNTGIVGTRVQQLATHPQIPGALLAGVYGTGLNRTSNGGASWTVESNGLTIPIFQGLAVAPTDSSIVYVATGSGLGGLFKSTDGGSNWIVTGPPEFMNTQAVAVDPVSSSTVYCSIYYGAPPGSTLFKSTDGARTWTPANDGLVLNGVYPVTVYSLIIDPVHSAVLYAIADFLLFKSTDAGDHWKYAQNAPGLAGSVYGLGIDPVNDQVLYAGTDAGTFKSTDGGGSWSATASSRLVKSAFSLVVDRSNPSVVYAATWSQGVFKSVDAGRNWNEISQGLATDRGVTSFAIDSADRSVIYAGVDGAGAFVMRQVPPAISGIVPASGPPAGRTTVTITGSNFAPGATVRFGDVPAFSTTVIGPETITAITPQGVTGPVDVVVTNANGQSGLVPAGFNYLLGVTRTPGSPRKVITHPFRP